MRLNHRHVSNMICAILEAHNLTLPQLSRRSNIPYTTLYGWTMGHTTPNYHSIVKLCQSIKLNPQFFKP